MMKRLRPSDYLPVFFVLFVMVSPGCAAAPHDEAVAVLAASKNIQSSTEHFSVCQGYGCKRRDIITFSSQDWNDVRRHFLPAPEDAAEERKAIENAVAEMERLVGARNGTGADKAGTFKGAFGHGQLDCEDEALNTTLYLSLFQTKGFLRFYDVGSRARRGYFIHGWPHMTATITEKQTQVVYVVDSWFADNGKVPFIIALEAWKDGAKP